MDLKVRLEQFKKEHERGAAELSKIQQVLQQTQTTVLRIEGAIAIIEEQLKPNQIEEQPKE